MLSYAIPRTFCFARSENNLTIGRDKNLGRLSVALLNLECGSADRFERYLLVRVFRQGLQKESKPKCELELTIALLHSHNDLPI